MILSLESTPRPKYFAMMAVMALWVIHPLTPKIFLVILLAVCIQFFWYYFWEFGIGSTDNSLIDTFL